MSPWAKAKAKAKAQAQAWSSSAACSAPPRTTCRWLASLLATSRFMSWTAEGVANVDVAYAAAQAKGLEVVRELRDEPWGIRRLFVRDPAGQAINVASQL